MVSVIVMLVMELLILLVVDFESVFFLSQRWLLFLRSLG